MRYEDVVLADGPVGYWPLNETSGTTAKGYGSTAVDGTYTSSPVLGAYPFPGGGRLPYFNGTSHVVIADNDAWTLNSGGWTLEVWWVPTNGTLGVDSGVELFTKMNASNYEWSLGAANYTGVGLVQCINGTLWSPTASSSWAVDSEDRLYVDNNSRLLHIVWTGTSTASSGASMSLIVNGRSRVKQSRGSIATYGNGTAQVQIAKRQDTSTQAAGFIGHAAIYNKVLDANRILAHYRAGLRRPVRQAFRTRAA